jgi:hypothetical protein
MSIIVAKPQREPVLRQQRANLGISGAQIGMKLQRHRVDAVSEPAIAKKQFVFCTLNVTFKKSDAVHAMLC